MSWESGGAGSCKAVAAKGSIVQMRLDVSRTVHTARDVKDLGSMGIDMEAIIFRPAP